METWDGNYSEGMERGYGNGKWMRKDRAVTKFELLHEYTWLCSGVTKIPIMALGIVVHYVAKPSRIN